MWIGRIGVIIIAVIAAVLHAIRRPLSCRSFPSHGRASAALSGPIVLLALFWKRTTAKARLPGWRPVRDFDPVEPAVGWTDRAV